MTGYSIELTKIVALGVLVGLLAFIWWSWLTACIVGVLVVYLLAVRVS